MKIIILLSILYLINGIYIDRYQKISREISRDVDGKLNFVSQNYITTFSMGLRVILNWIINLSILFLFYFFSKWYFGIFYATILFFLPSFFELFSPYPNRRSLIYLMRDECLKSSKNDDEMINKHLMLMKINNILGIDNY